MDERVIEIGDRVLVKSGPHIGEIGRVIGIDGSFVEVWLRSHPVRIDNIELERIVGR